MNTNSFANINRSQSSLRNHSINSTRRIKTSLAMILRKQKTCQNFCPKKPRYSIQNCHSQLKKWVGASHTSILLRLGFREVIRLHRLSGINKLTIWLLCLIRITEQPFFTLTLSIHQTKDESGFFHLAKAFLTRSSTKYLLEQHTILLISLMKITFSRSIHPLMMRL